MELDDEEEDDSPRCSEFEGRMTRPLADSTGEGRVDPGGKIGGLEDRRRSGREVRDVRLG